MCVKVKQREEMAEGGDSRAHREATAAQCIVGAHREDLALKM